MIPREGSLLVGIFNALAVTGLGVVALLLLLAALDVL